MEDLDFTKTSESTLYDPATAQAFFESGGTRETIAEGATIFAEQPQDTRPLQKDARMYLLVEGNVRLMAGAKAIDTLRPGEIFGEMAVIGEMPRTATAIAKTACQVISMELRQFHAALGRMPEFALMLMNIMINRLRFTNARLSMTRALPTGERHEGRVFDDAMLSDLRKEGRAMVPVPFKATKPIMAAGETGLYMYVVLEGRVVISVQDRVVERLGPGGVFGEMALIDQSPRAASAAAETDCSLLRVSRSDLLDTVRNKPAFGVALLKTLADRLRYMTSHLPPR